MDNTNTVAQLDTFFFFHILFIIYTYKEQYKCCERATQPYSPSQRREGEVRFFHALSSLRVFTHPLQHVNHRYSINNFTAVYTSLQGPFPLDFLQGLTPLGFLCQGPAPQDFFDRGVSSPLDFLCQGSLPRTFFNRGVHPPWFFLSRFSFLGLFCQGCFIPPGFFNQGLLPRTSVQGRHPWVSVQGFPSLWSFKIKIQEIHRHVVFQNQNSRNSKSKFKKFTGNSQQKQIINQKRKQYYESADKERKRTTTTTTTTKCLQEYKVMDIKIEHVPKKCYQHDLENKANIYNN